MTDITRRDGNDGIFRSPTVTTAKRALGFGKTYIVIAIFFTLIATSFSYGVFSAFTKVLNFDGSLANAVTHLTFIEVPLGLIAELMLVTPIIILFVYDKNNGVLEYLLSLGMTQRDIYMHYLKAALLIASLYLVVFVTVNLAFSYLLSGLKNIAVISTVLFLVIIMAISVIAFVITVMMIFSSLQKPRAGGNQPLGLSIGSFVGALPSLLFTFTLSFNKAIIAEIALAIVITLAFFSLFILSDKLIKREKFLP